MANGKFVLCAALVGSVACCVAGAFEVGGAAGPVLRLDDKGHILSVAVQGRDLPCLPGPGGFFATDCRFAPSAGAELIRNGDFSEGVLRWEFGRDWRITEDPDALYSKGKSACVSLTPSDRSRSGFISQKVKVDPDTAYIFSLSMKTENCQGTATDIWLGMLGEDGTNSSKPGMITMQGGRNDSQGSWYHREQHFRTGPDTHFVSVRYGIYDGNGKVWIDDVSLRSTEASDLGAAKAILGAFRDNGDGGTFAGAEQAMGLTLNARFRALGDRIRISGELADTTGKDRAIRLWLRLPLALDGRWTFGYDINREIVTDGALPRYSNVYIVAPGQTSSQYPWASVRDAESGLAVSVPMDQPRVFRLEYVPKVGFCAVFDLGLSKETAKFPGKASFFCDVYGFAPKWGFRAATQRYYDLFPEFFSEWKEGNTGWGGYGINDWSLKDRPLDYGLGIHAFEWSANRDVLDDRAAGVTIVPYTEPNGYWGWRLGVPAMPKGSPQPAPEQLEKDLRAKAAAGNPAAVTCLDTVVFDAEGRCYAGGWMPEYGGAHWLCNPDPDILNAEGRVVNQATDWWKKCVTENRTYFLEGAYSDAGPFKTQNFRREHFRYVDHPLSFDPATCKVCVPPLVHSFEFFEWFHRKLREKGQNLLLHWTSCGYPTYLFGIQFGDTVGSEQHGAAMSEDQYVTLRTLCYRKSVQSFTSSDKVSRSMGEQYARQDMAYGVFSNNERDPVVGRLYGAMQRELGRAGWEPITGARVVEGKAHIERFGRLRDRNLHFVIRNETPSKQAAKIELSRRDLDWGGESLQMQVVEHLYCADAPRATEDAAFTVALAPGDVRVVRVGSVEAIAEMLRPEIVRQWQGAGRFMSQAAWAQAPTLARKALGGSPLMDAAILRRLMGECVQSAGKDVWVRKTALALAEADGLESMVRLLWRGQWVSPPAEWLVQPGRPVFLGAGMRMEAPSELLINAQAVTATIGTVLPELIVKGHTLSVSSDAPDGLYVAYWEWPASDPLEAPYRRYFDVQVGSPVQTEIVPHGMAREMKTANLRVSLRNCSMQALSGTLASFAPAGYAIVPASTNVVLPPGGQVAVRFRLNRTHDIATNSLCVRTEFAMAGQVYKAEQTIRLTTGLPVAECPRFSAPPKLDGVLDDPCWKAAFRTAPLLLPGGGAPTQKTVAFIGYDSNSLYVALDCRENRMADTRTAVTEDNRAVYTDDSVETWIVPHHVAANCAQGVANMIGTRYTAGILGAWQTAAHREPDGWTIEMAFPFSIFGEEPPQPGDVWGLNVGRSECPHKETSAWSPPGFHDRSSDATVIFE